MYKISNFLKNRNVKILDQQGAFKVIEYQQDISVTPEIAPLAYYASAMNVRKRQVVCDLRQTEGVTVQAGAMQWMLGNVNATTGVKGVGDLVSKAFRGKVSGESAIKPEYTGNGLLVLEPTYRYLILLKRTNYATSLSPKDADLL